MISSYQEDDHRQLYSAPQEEAIKRFQDTLSLPTAQTHEETLSSTLQNLFFETLCYAETTFKPDLDCIVIRYLCYGSLQNGAFVYMDQITHRISALQWLCQMTIYNKIMYEQQNGSTVHELTEHSEEPAAPALALNCITSSTRIGRLCNKLEIDIRPTIKSSR